MLWLFNWTVFFAINFNFVLMIKSCWKLFYSLWIRSTNLLMSEDCVYHETNFCIVTNSNIILPCSFQAFSSSLRISLSPSLSSTKISLINVTINAIKKTFDLRGKFYQASWFLKFVLTGFEWTWINFIFLFSSKTEKVKLRRISEFEMLRWLTKL